jgi:hypothetical protein
MALIPSLTGKRNTFYCSEVFDSRYIAWYGTWFDVCKPIIRMKSVALSLPCEQVFMQTVFLQIFSAHAPGSNSWRFLKRRATESGNFDTWGCGHAEIFSHTHHTQKYVEEHHFSGFLLPSLNKLFILYHSYELLWANRVFIAHPVHWPENFCLAFFLYISLR